MPHRIPGGRSRRRMAAVEAVAMMNTKSRRFQQSFEVCRCDCIKQGQTYEERCASGSNKWNMVMCGLASQPISRRTWDSMPLEEGMDSVIHMIRGSLPVRKTDVRHSGYKMVEGGVR